jgi:hypothetical protein
MRTPILVALVIVTVLSFRTVVLPAPATAQGPVPVGQYEFKAVLFGNDEKESTKKLNDLAQEGWEYVGPLANGLVAFRKLATGQPKALTGGKVRIEATSPREIKLGGKGDILIKLHREGNDGEVKVSFSSIPKGLKIVPQNLVIEKGKNDGKVRIEAMPAAALGEQVIVLDGTTAEGATVKLELKINVIK